MGQYNDPFAAVEDALQPKIRTWVTIAQVLIFAGLATAIRFKIKREGLNGALGFIAVAILVAAGLSYFFPQLIDAISSITAFYSSGAS